MPGDEPLSRCQTSETVAFFWLAPFDAGATIGGMNEPRTFAEFWTFYVLAHRQPLTRIFHTAGTLVGWSLLVTAIVLRKPWYVLAAFAVPYALAWFSHFFVEHNRPATFGHPLWSWLADQKMVAMVLAGKMEAEVQRFASVERAGSTA
jgi:hypothetical protein